MDREQYIEVERTDRSKVYSYQKMLFRYKLSKKFLKPGTVLDVGCGYGFGADILNNYQYTSIDYYDKSVQIASSNYPQASFLHMQAPPINLPTASFNNVVCTEVIEHMAEEQGKLLLTEMYRVLKPGGIMFLTTPNFDNREKFLPEHVLEYGSQHLTQVVNETGFRITYRGGLCISFLFGRNYPNWFKRWYRKSNSHSTTGAKRTKASSKKLAVKIGKSGIKTAGNAMIYLGYMFPKKAKYQILVCKK
tara:strand:+ start:24706 stop:25449 length:744 start_codon:yes stop_codon:yes gene_type:complete